MGLLERRAAKNSDAAAEDLRRGEQKALAAWQQRGQDLEEMLGAVRNENGTRDGVTLMLKKDERAFRVLQGSALIEPRRLPGHWEGRSQGFSLRVAKGVRYRVGASRGHYVAGDEVPTPIDAGTVTITDQRVVFQGPKATREWAFSKVLGLQHVDARRSPWTAIQVSNRQKTSGFLYTPETAAGVRFHGEVDEMARNLEEQIAEHNAECPVAQPTGGELRPEVTAVPATADAQTAGWFADPARRHQFRYFDGDGWTAHVADDGKTASDPL